MENAVKRFRNEYKNLSGKTVEELEVQELRLFLMDICGYIKKYITDSVGIRVHFRGERKIFLCLWEKFFFDKKQICINVLSELLLFCCRITYLFIVFPI